MDTTKHKPIHGWVWNPNGPSLFKSKANEHAECTVMYCEIPDRCPLLPKKQCANYQDFFGMHRCPHGYVRKEQGPTKRSKTCFQWVAKKNEEIKDIIGKVAGSPPDKMLELGDWIYLPYSHITMNEGVPFRSHSAAFISGSPYLRKEDFTLNNIKKIVDFRPFALFGGEITDYQTKEVPKFLQHLRELYFQLYNDLILANSSYIFKYKLDAPPNYVGRKAIIRTLNPCTLEIGKHTFKWDGGFLISTHFDPLWINVEDQNGRKAIDSIVVNIVPAETAVIKITDNQQVGPQTVFVD